MVEFMQQEATLTSEVYCKTLEKLCRVGHSEQKVQYADSHFWTDVLNYWHNSSTQTFSTVLVVLEHGPLPRGRQHNYFKHSLKSLLTRMCVDVIILPGMATKSVFNA
jgi:hypothetical protein